MNQHCRKRGNLMHPYFENKPEHIYTGYYEQPHDFPLHFHNNLEISFCFSGCQNIRVGEKVYCINKGDAIVIFPNNIHEYTADSSQSAKTMFMIFNTKLLSETVPEIITKYPENPYIPASKISTDLKIAFKKLAKSENHIEKIGLAFIILSELMQAIPLQPLETNLNMPAKITSYIDDHFTENLTINHLSKVFGYHPSYIAHIFCDHLKIPFRTYLGSLRCQYAAKQIRTSKKSLTEIAYESGFNSLNTFCRCFKTHMGKTPSQYKKEHTTL